MVEEPRYEIIKRIESVELRQYPAMLLATAIDDSDPFGLLFRYISGANKGGRKISMTAPVIQPEKIAMTSPVFTRGNTMSFITPSSFTRETIPEPTDPRIIIEEVPARTLAVLRFSGWAGDAAVEKKKKQLLDIIAKNSIKTKGEALLMRYDSPFTLWFIRRNEVAIEVE